MEIPARLYKYTSVSFDSLLNLQARTVYFGSPKKFNDPYDCALSGVVGTLSDNGLERLLQNIGSNRIFFNKPESNGTEAINPRRLGQSLQ